MQVVGILDYGLAKVADMMTRHVIAPAVRSGSHSFSVEEKRLDSGYIAEVVLRITPPSDSQVFIKWHWIFHFFIYLMYNTNNKKYY